MSPDPANSPLNPAALTVRDAVRLLAKVGGTAITEAQVQADIASGAPTNPDGTLNLVIYAAWLVQGMGRGTDHDAGAPHGD
jgi:hypothetical protein